MAIKLSKGQKIDLTRDNPLLSSMKAGRLSTAAITRREARARRQNFGMVCEAYIRIVDESSGQELIRFDLKTKFSNETTIVVGEIYRHKGQWRFNAIGAGFDGGLEALCRNFGVEVANDEAPRGSSQPFQPSSAQLKEIVMDKWQQIDLEKSDGSYGAITFEFIHDRSLQSQTLHHEGQQP